MVIKHFFRCFGADNLFEKAQEISEKKRVEYRNLYESFHIDPSSVSFLYLFVSFYFFLSSSNSYQNQFDSLNNIEFTPNSNEAEEAYDLLEYQYLLMKKGICRKEDFVECVNSKSENIPNEYKCKSPSGPCKKNQK